MGPVFYRRGNNRDGISDFKVLAEYKREASKEIGDKLFARKCEQNSSDSRSGYESTDIYPERSEDEEHGHYPNSNGYSPMNEGKYFFN